MNKKIFSLLILIAICFTTKAQSRYLWTHSGADNNWRNAANWQLVDGPAAWGNYPSGITSIALFGSTPYGTSSNDNCLIDGNNFPNGGLYVGGIEINGYAGTITQDIYNRLIISDCPSLNGCAYNPVYKAVFNFGPGGKFIGSTTTNLSGTLDYQDNYTIAIGVKLEIIAGDFFAPRKLLLENSCDITPACFHAAGFDGSGGVVSFYPRPSSLISTYSINAHGVVFYDLQCFGGKHLDFSGNNMIVKHDLITSGASQMHIDNGNIYVRGNVIVDATDVTSYSYGAGSPTPPGGTATIILGGKLQQSIIKNPTTTEIGGPLPNVIISNIQGVNISGKVAIGTSMQFQNGIVRQQTPGSTNDVLVFYLIATVSGANDNSYVNGPVKKHFYSLPTASFEFPVGKNGNYHPVILSGVTGGSSGYGSANTNYYTQFTAEYFDSDPALQTPGANYGAGVYALRNCEYWTLQRNNLAGSNAKVSLSWNTGSCNYFPYFNTPSDLKVAQYDGSTSTWNSRGASSTGTYLLGQTITEATGQPASQFDGSASTLFTFCHATPQLTAVISSSSNVTCNGGNDGTATVYATSSTGSTLSFAWNTTPVQTGQTATGLAAGNYVVTVTDASGTTANANVTITEPNPNNLVSNFDFSNGDVGFSSLPLNCGCTANSYCIGTQIIDKCNNATWTSLNFNDHTTGTGNFLIIDGSSSINAVVWSQAVSSILPNTDYTFSFWAKSLYSQPFNIDFLVDGNLVGTSTSINWGAWTQYTTTWNSGSSPATITLGLRQETAGGYRDFGIDDIFFGTTCGDSQQRLATGVAQPEKLENQISLYPNPSNGMFTLGSMNKDEKSIFVYDINGKVVFEKHHTIEQSINVDITNESKGIYFVKVITSEGITLKKMINQ